MHLKVYNKYGERVFEASNQGIGWDGAYFNRDENPGVFTWVLDYNLVDGRIGRISGNTTLFRYFLHKFYFLKTANQSTAFFITKWMGCQIFNKSDV